MARAFPRVPQPSASSRHRGESVAVEEAREVPESSLLLSNAISWSMQVVHGHRNNAHRSLPEHERSGVPPAISISTTYDRNSIPSGSQPFNHWPASPRLLPRDRLQASSFPTLSQRNPAPSTRPWQIRPRSESPFTFSIIEAHGASTPASTHVSAPPSAPPPLHRQPHIALPTLSPLTPIQIHSIISFHSSLCGPDAPIYWNISLPPSTARLAAALGGLAAAHWSHEVAVEPRTQTSLTIRIAGVARPVVVFAAEMRHPIRIVDVLRAIYNAVCRAALESVQRRVVGNLSAAGRDSSASVAVDEAAAADAIRRHFRGGVWWGGLYESTDERDVWILELRGTERGW